MTSQTFFCNFISLKNITFFKNMPWQQYLQYLQDYAQHFDMTPRIQFNTRVTKVTSTADYSETGRYIYIKCNIVHMKVKLLFHLIQEKSARMLTDLNLKNSVQAWPIETKQ